MYRHLNDFVKDWTAENAATLKVLHVLTDASLRQCVEPDGRTLGGIAWHMVLTIPEMLGRVQLPVVGPEEGTPMPGSAAEIAACYEATTQSVLTALRENWTDDTLEVVSDMYGEEWANGFTLKALLGHEIHHRGQMTVLMRQAGLAVPGVYGPSREEWASYGMPPMP